MVENSIALDAINKEAVDLVYVLFCKMIRV